MQVQFGRTIFHLKKKKKRRYIQDLNLGLTLTKFQVVPLKLHNIYGFLHQRGHLKKRNVLYRPPNYMYTFSLFSFLGIIEFSQMPTHEYSWTAPATHNRYDTRPIHIKYYGNHVGFQEIKVYMLDHVGFLRALKVMYQTLCSCAHLHLKLLYFLLSTKEL